MPDIQMEVWKDEDGVRLVFNDGEELDFSYDAIERLIVALDEYVSNEPKGAYKLIKFDVVDDEED